MAKPLNLDYSGIWNRRSIEALNATEVGAYICLTRAMILHGHDPLPTDEDTLQRLSRLTRRQWQRYSKRIHEALNETMGHLKTDYAYSQKCREKRLWIASRAVEARRRNAELRKQLITRS